MNTPIRRIGFLVMIMFLALMAQPTWVQYGQAGDPPAFAAKLREVLAEG